MKRLLVTILGCAMALPLAMSVQANEELLVRQQNPSEWAMPTGNYANHRYSQLAQIHRVGAG